LGKALSNNRIGKISEIYPSSFWQGAEQEQNRQISEINLSALSQNVSM